MNKVIVIIGPTAVGKTKLSIELAHYFDGEIINADSTQVYKDLDIATAKVTEEEKENIPHHLFDIKNIDENYTVFDYQKDARKKIEEILSRGKTPILVGGTGLYIKAALYDYQFLEEENKNTFDKFTNIELYNKLKELDPDIDIHVNNRRRLVRALNYITYHNQLYSARKKTNCLLYDAIFLGLTTTRPLLYERIDKRVDSMIQNGLLKEAKTLYDKGIYTKAVMTPIGYKELFMYFNHETGLEEAINLIKQRSRRYAKRQYTWINNQMDVKWFEVDFNNFDNTIKSIKEYIEKC